MKNGKITMGLLSCSSLATLAIFFSAEPLRATSYVSTSSGPWESAGTWSPNGVPGAADSVFINNTNTVTVSAADAAAGVVIGDGVLNLDFSTVGGSELLAGVPSLTFGGTGANGTLCGGILALNGQSGSSDTQSFAGFTLACGGNNISNVLNSAANLVVNLGPITRAAGAGSLNVTNPADGPIVTTISTTNANNFNLLGGWATYDGTNWATVDTTGTGPFPIIPLDGSALTINNNANNWTPDLNIFVNGSFSGHLTGTVAVNSINWTANDSLTLDGGSVLQVNNGILFPLNNRNQSTYINGNSGALLEPGTNNELIINCQCPGTTMSLGNNANWAITDNGANPCTFVKTGPGKLRLIQSPILVSGPVFVQQGGLSMNTSASIPNAASIFIAAGATLQVDDAQTYGGGSIAQDISGGGGYNTGGGGQAPVFGPVGTCHPGGTNTPGQLTFGVGVTFQSGSTAYFDLGATAAAPNDEIVVKAGSSTIEAGANLVINQFNGTLGAGSYLLFNAANAGGIYPDAVNQPNTPVSAGPGGINVTFTGAPAPASWGLQTDATTGHSLYLNVTNTALTGIQFDTSPANLNYGPNGAILTVTGLSSQGPVIIYASTDLMTWLPILTNPPVTGTLQFQDNSATNYPYRFYRAQEQ